MDQYYDELMIVKTQLEFDEFIDEHEIIKELKYFLMGKGLNDSDEINNIIKGFYDHCGFDVPLETIKSIRAVNLTNDLFQLLMNSGGVAINPNNVLSQIPEEKKDDLEESDTDESSEEAVSGPAMTSSSAPPVHGNPLTVAHPPFSNLQGLETLMNLIQNEFNQMIQEQQQELDDDNVIVTLDDEEFEKIKVSTVQETLDTPCTVCCCEIEKDQEMSELPCKHIFHTECINPWLKEYNNKCPVCRQECGKAKYSNV